jgi:hypothetical protein
MFNTIDFKVLTTKELDFARKVILTYTRNDTPDTHYPPHSKNCNWVKGTKRDINDNLICDCGVMVIIDEWDPPKDMFA